MYNEMQTINEEEEKRKSEFFRLVYENEYE